MYDLFALDYFPLVQSFQVCFFLKYPRVSQSVEYSGSLLEAVNEELFDQIFD